MSGGFGGSTLEQAVLWLDMAGLTDVLLPFFLVFTILYAILQRSKILGEDKKNFNIIISLVISFAVIIPHITGMYPPNADVVNIINKAIPNVSLVIVLMVMFLLMIGLLGGGARLNAGGLSGGIALIAFIVVVYIFGAAADFWMMPSVLDFLNSPDVQALIVIVLVFGILVWFITREDRPHTPEEAGRGFLRNIGEGFFGGGGQGGH
ncbi:hypothetical protein HYU19_04770 [Candidatus Woesearchaeota archaeon]|nr:hypothetical protein [Candidatus Woesearchaeota archaeon]